MTAREVVLTSHLEDLDSILSSYIAADNVHNFSPRKSKDINPDEVKILLKTTNLPKSAWECIDNLNKVVRSKRHLISIVKKYFPIRRLQ